MTVVIQAVLFDADGVFQRRPVGWRETLAQALGVEGRSDEFLTELFSSEIPALEGRSDFTAGLANALVRWDSRASLEDVLRVWTTIEVDPEITAAVDSLRHGGIRCYLTSNQEEYKASYMSAVLGHARLFDSEFYSCRVGSMKPSAEYFHAVVHEIALPPEQMLFIDDRAENVAGARGVGLHAETFSRDAGLPELVRILDQHGLSGLLLTAVGDNQQSTSETLGG
ncbi:MAG: HAD-IA family hydrolase [Chloroflexota bacterium]